MNKLITLVIPALVFFAFFASMNNGTIIHIVPVNIPGSIYESNIIFENNTQLYPQSQNKTTIPSQFDLFIFIKQLLGILGVNYG